MMVAVGSRDGLDYYREHDSRSIPFFGLNLPAFSEAASKVMAHPCVAHPCMALPPAATPVLPPACADVPALSSTDQILYLVRQLKRICAAMEPAKWNVTFGSEGRAGDKMTAAYSVNRDSLGLSVDADDGAAEGSLLGSLLHGGGGCVGAWGGGILPWHLVFSYARDNGRTAADVGA